jgi:hypothetical protein
MNSEQYKAHLLKMIPSAKVASGGKVINCRCFFCPDSRNPNSAHMYISIPQADDEPSLYYCHKCHAKGLVTYKTLIEWDIYNDDVAMDLIEHNKKCSKNVLKQFKSNKYRVILNTTKDNHNSEIKLKYINDRIGTRYNYADLRQLKIVLNLEDLLKDNHVDELTRDDLIVEQLDINFVGFLSIDNAFLNMRRVCKEGLLLPSIDKRYINYRIFSKLDTSERFYTIPTTVDLCSLERVKVHIAEGPFDILSIYENLRGREPGIYTSVAGSNYKGQVIYFLEMYKLQHVEFHIYPDNDKQGSNRNIDKIGQFLKPLHIPLYIHRNTFEGEKDFGVRPENIIESIIEWKE